MRRIIVLIILAHLTLSGISQTASDSITCLPNSKLRKAIRKIEDCKILKEELVATKGTISILQNRIELRDNLIKSYMVKDSLYEKRLFNMQSIILLKDNEISNYKRIEAIQNIKLKLSKINLINSLHCSMFNYDSLDQWFPL